MEASDALRAPGPPVTLRLETLENASGVELPGNGATGQYFRLKEELFQRRGHPVGSRGNSPFFLVEKRDPLSSPCNSN